MTPEELMEMAKESIKMAYAPYSNFKVGAAVLAKSGKVYVGCNIENASYGLSLCAERVAIHKAISEREDISAVAVASESGNSQLCGSCRQVILEFNPNADVYFLKNDELVETIASQLLPEPFVSAYLP
jgi:cytidine deaminase